MDARRDRGAAAVEMALLLPLLLLLVFGIVDFGRMLHAQITVTEAAREGARAAVILNSRAAAQSRVDRVMNGATVDVLPDDTPCDTTAPGADATVKVSARFEFVTPVGAIAAMFISPAGFGGDVTLTATGVMPCRA
ncbi:MAG TPA: TadE/TadG family type IV pilus assembly protein [Candidatus Limnocylindrales bacterium]